MIKCLYRRLLSIGDDWFIDAVQYIEIFGLIPHFAMQNICIRFLKNKQLFAVNKLV